MLQYNLCETSNIPSLITTLQMVGVFIGACVTGQIADIRGRRRVFYSVYALLLLTGVLTSFSPMWQLYAVARFFVGIFFGGQWILVTWVVFNSTKKPRHSTQHL